METGHLKRGKTIGSGMRRGRGRPRIAWTRQSCGLSRKKIIWRARYMIIRKMRIDLKNWMKWSMPPGFMQKLLACRYGLEDYLPCIIS